MIYLTFYFFSFKNRGEHTGSFPLVWPQPGQCFVRKSNSVIQSSCGTAVGRTLSSNTDEYQILISHFCWWWLLQKKMKNSETNHRLRLTAKAGMNIQKPWNRIAATSNQQVWPCLWLINPEYPPPHPQASGGPSPPPPALPAPPHHLYPQELLLLLIYMWIFWPYFVHFYLKFIVAYNKWCVILIL